MQCSHIPRLYRCLSTFFFHYVTPLAFAFLINSIICFSFFLFAEPPIAFSQAEIIPVQIEGLAQPPGFSPALLTLHINETVLFINHASPARSYTLRADDGSFSSPPIPTGGQWKITFHTPGSHTYRDTSTAQTMVGELLVVNKGISLLATPNPLVMATVTALIKNGQNPPDSIIIATHKHSTPSPSSSSLLPLIILVMSFSISITLLGILALTYYKRYRQRLASADEETIAFEFEDDNHENSKQAHIIIGNLKKKLQALPHFLRRKTDENEGEDEDEDEDKDEDEDD